MNPQTDNNTLTASQQAAMDKIISFVTSSDKRVFILKGYAGTGKTTLVKVIIQELKKLNKCFTLLASTGRAAKVLSDATSSIEVDEEGEESSNGLSASTIHSLIYKFSDLNQDLDLFGQPNGNSEVATNKGVRLLFSLKTREEGQVEMIYIVDESSMVSDTEECSNSQAQYGTEGRLLRDLLSYDPEGKFIFIGDICQLPPAYQSFSPALSASYFQETFGIEADEAELTEVVRQAEGNDISLSAARIRKSFFETPTGDIAKFPFRGYRNIHILNNEIEMLNKYIDCIRDKDYSKATLITMSNKQVSQNSNLIRPSLGFNSRHLCVGDLLLVTQNNLLSGLMNGDMVKVLQIGRRERRAGLTFVYVEVESLVTGVPHSQLLIEDIIFSGQTNISQEQQTHLFIDYHERMKELGIKQRSVQYKEGMFRDSYLNALRCVFGYALTCHKSQGGEWNSVFLIIPRGLPYNNPRSYAYQWVYTAMTRAKKELYVLNDYWISS